MITKLEPQTDKARGDTSISRTLNGRLRVEESGGDTSLPDGAERLDDKNPVQTTADGDTLDKVSASRSCAASRTYHCQPILHCCQLFPALSS